MKIKAAVVWEKSGPFKIEEIELDNVMTVGQRGDLNRE